jgi:hypothetical protein
MRVGTIRLMCLVLAIELIVRPASAAEQSSGSSTTTAPATPNSANGPLSDYVPCIFNEDDQFAMRALPSEKPLDKVSAEQLFNEAKIAIQPALAKFSQSPAFLKAFREYFESHVYANWLEGRTPDQAILIIQTVLYDAVAVAAATQTGGVRADEEVQSAKSKAAGALVAKAETAINALSADKKKIPQELVAAGTSAIADATDLTPDYKADVLSRYQGYSDSLMNASSAPGTANLPLAMTSRDVLLSVEAAAVHASGYPYTSPSVNVGDSSAAVTLRADLASITKQAGKESQAKQFQPPNDVSCSMAVMSWKETRDIFGRRVANTFVAIQVTLRNLNTKNEFLVHDIQVAIDTGVTPGYFGRFQAGRDKLLVRAVAQRGQSSDRRNVVLNVLQTVGAISAASSLTAGTVEFKDAVAVFQGAFMTGFANIFPDHTVEQLNHINDLVFSASNTSKVLVPVQGSVPLVTFISEKPIEQLPFAWCGHPAQGHLNPERWFGLGPEQNCNFNGGKHNPGYVTPYRYTKHAKQLPPTENKNYPVGPSVQPPKDDNDDELPLEDNLPPWDDLQYRDWRGAAVRMLQEHTYVVVGGVHIQAIATQPKLANLTCPQLKSDQVDLSQAQNGTVSCKVTGSGLGLISAINLQKSDSKIPGTIAAATDGNSAALQFKPEDLCSADGAYSLFVTYKSDTQKEAAPLDTGTQVLLTPQPAISGSPTLAGNTLTLNGKCMDKITGVSIVKPDKTTLDGTDLKPSDKQLTATFTTLVSGTTYPITYKIAAQTEPIAPPSLTVAATAGAATPNPAPASPVSAHTATGPH